MIRSRFLWLKHLLYAVVILALVCCLTEIGLRVYDSATGQITRRDFYDRGMVCKSWFVHHTLKPSRAFSVRNPDNDARVRISLNSFGLRGAEPPAAKPAGTLRIVCLGDEATFAQHIEDHETFCGQLQAALGGRLGRRVEVINAGVPEYCPLLSYLQVKQQLLGLQADILIVNFDMSDVGDDYLYRRSAAISAEGAPVSCAHPGLEMPRAVKAGKKKGELPLLLPEWGKQKIGALLAQQALGEKTRSIESDTCRYLWLEDQPPDWTTYIGQSLAPIEHLRDLVKGQGTAVIVSVVPAPWQVSPQASNGSKVREQAGVDPQACFKSRRPFELIGEFCRSRGIPCGDASEAFQRHEQPDRLYLKNAAALSVEGHALYSAELARLVESRFVGGGESAAPPRALPPEQQARLIPR